MTVMTSPNKEGRRDGAKGAGSFIGGMTASVSSFSGMFSGRAVETDAELPVKPSGDEKLAQLPGDGADEGHGAAPDEISEEADVGAEDGDVCVALSLMEEREALISPEFVDT